MLCISCCAIRLTPIDALWIAPYRVVSIIINALRQSETFDDWKNTALKERREADAINNTIRAARRAIANEME